MASFSGEMEGENNWDLYAVVRSCRSTARVPSAAETRDTCSFSCPPFPPAFPVKEELVLGQETRFPDLVGGSRDGALLEELCKPFISQPQLHQPISPSPPPPPPPPPALLRPRIAQIPRSRRRKNQQKRVVCHVPADGLASDVWAWRKYGQKPIKGSPYPRGYYRCSSSKGCQARKQVERSREDPGVLIITYTAEHNHPVPTHRNSLAGSTRSKFSPTGGAAGADGDAALASPPTSAAGLSPTTPLTSSMEEDGGLLVEDMEVLGDDDLVFMGIDEVDGGDMAAEEEDDVSRFFEDQSFPPPPPWLANDQNNNNAAAAAGSG